MKIRRRTCYLFATLVASLGFCFCASLFITGHSGESFAGRRAAYGEEGAAQSDEARDMLRLLAAAVERAEHGELTVSHELMDVVRSRADADLDEELRNAIAAAESRIADMEEALPHRLQELLALVDKAVEAVEDHDFAGASSALAQVKGSKLYGAFPQLQTRAQAAAEHLRSRSTIVQPLHEEARDRLQRAKNALAAADVPAARAWIARAQELDVVQRPGELRELADLLAFEADELERRIRDRAVQERVADAEAAAVVLMTAAEDHLQRWNVKQVDELLDVLGASDAYRIVPGVADAVGELGTRLDALKATMDRQQQAAEALLLTAREQLQAGELEQAAAGVEELRALELYEKSPAWQHTAAQLEDGIRVHRAERQEGIRVALQQLAEAGQAIADERLEDAQRLVDGVSASPAFRQDDEVSARVARLEDVLAARRAQAAQMAGATDRLLALLTDAEAAIARDDWGAAEDAIRQVRADELLERLPDIGARTAAVEAALEESRREHERLERERQTAQEALRQVQAALDAEDWDTAGHLLQAVRQQPLHAHDDGLQDEVRHLETALADAIEAQDRARRTEEEARLQAMREEADGMLREAEDLFRQGHTEQAGTRLADIRDLELFHLSMELRHAVEALEHGIAVHNARREEERQAFLLGIARARDLRHAGRFSEADAILADLTDSPVYDDDDAKEQLDTLRAELASDMERYAREAGHVEELLSEAHDKVQQNDVAGARRLLTRIRDTQAYRTTESYRDRARTLDEAVTAAAVAIHNERRQAVLRIEEAEQAAVHWNFDAALRLLDDVESMSAVAASPALAREADEARARVHAAQQAALDDIASAEEALQQAESLLQNHQYVQAREQVEMVQRLDSHARREALRTGARRLMHRIEELETAAGQAVSSAGALIRQAEQHVVDYEFDAAARVLDTVRESLAYSVDAGIAADVERLERRVEQDRAGLEQARDRMDSLLSQARQAIAQRELEPAATAIARVMNEETYRRHPDVVERATTLQAKLSDAVRKHEAMEQSRRRVRDGLYEAHEALENEQFEQARRHLDRIASEPAYEESGLREEHDELKARLSGAIQDAQTARLRRDAEEALAAVGDQTKQRKIATARALLDAIRHSEAYALSDDVRSAHARRSRDLELAASAGELLDAAGDAFRAGDYPNTVELVERYRDADVDLDERFDREADRMHAIAASVLDEFDMLFRQAAQRMDAGDYDAAIGHWSEVAAAPVVLRDDLAEQARARISEARRLQRQQRIENTLAALTELERLQMKAVVEAAWETIDQAASVRTRPDSRSTLERLMRVRDELRGFHPGDEAEDVQARLDEAVRMMQQRLEAYEQLDRWLEQAAAAAHEQRIQDAAELLEQGHAWAGEHELVFDRQQAAAERRIRDVLATEYLRDREPLRQRYLKVLDLVQSHVRAGDAHTAEALMEIVEGAEKLLFTDTERARIQSLSQEIRTATARTDAHLAVVQRGFERARELVAEGDSMEALHEYRAVIGYVIDNDLPADRKIAVLESYLQAVEEVLPQAMEAEMARLQAQAEEEIRQALAMLPYHMAAFWIESGAYDVARGDLEAVAACDVLDDVKKQWAARELDALEAHATRIREDELLAIQPDVDEAHALVRQSIAHQQEGRHEQAQKLRRRADNLQRRIIRKQAEMALSRNAYPRVAELVARNRRLLQTDTQPAPDMQHVLNVAARWNRAAQAREALTAAAQDGHIAAYRAGLNDLAEAGLSPCPCAGMRSEWQRIDSALQLRETPEHVMAQIPGRAALRTKIERIERRRALRGAYLECVGHFIQDDMARASEQAHGVIANADRDTAIERAFAEWIVAGNIVLRAARAVDGRRWEEAAAHLDAAADTSAYAVDAALRGQVRDLRQEVQRALDRRTAHELLARGEQRLSDGELREAEDIVSDIRQLKSYSALDDVQARVRDLELAVALRTRQRRELQHKTEDIMVLLDRAEDKAGLWQFRTADAIMEYVVGLETLEALPAVQERYNEVVQRLNSERSEAEEHLQPAMVRLDRSRELLADGDFDGADAVLKELRRNKVYARMEHFRNEVDALAVRIDVARRTDEALGRLSEADHRIESGQLAEAEDLLVRIGQRAEWMDIEAVRTAYKETVQRLGEAVQRAEARRERIRAAELLLDEAEKALQRWDYETADGRLRDAAAGIALSEELQQRAAGIRERIAQAGDEVNEVMVLLEKASQRIDEGDLAPAGEMLEEIASLPIAGVVPAVRDGLSRLQQAHRIETARVEAAPLLADIEQHIADRNYRKAARLVSEARDKPHHELLSEFRSRIRDFQVELEHAEQRAQELYRRASQAYWDDDIETLRTLLRQLQEQYGNTHFYAENM